MKKKNSKGNETVKIRDYWFSSKVRESARNEYGETAQAEQSIAEVLITAMSAKRDIRRHKENIKKGRIYTDLKTAQKVLDDTLEALDMTLTNAKQMSRSLTFKGQRVFDIRLPAELE